MSKNYRYHLLKYHGKASRLTCPQCGRPHCFTPYVDDDENIIGEEYGRCDHESSCGYVKYPPSQDESWRKPPSWLEKPKKTSKPLRKPTPELEGDVSTLPMEVVQKTVRTNPLSAFLRFLTKLFDTDTILRVIADYLIGVTKAGDVIFYQFDIKGRCRTGKVMKYNPEDGHRIKDEAQPGRITWVHTLLKKQLPEKWELKQCLFGEHLLARYPDKPVVLVEAEKTAIIGSAVMPECNWLATGGKGQLNDRVDVLEGRKVVAFPDSDAYDTWREKVAERPWLTIHVSDYILRKATPEQKAAGADVADILIAWKLGRLTTPPSVPDKNPILEEIRRYISPEYLDNVMALIEELDLEIVSVERIIPKNDENPA